jgi:hypothetical protein
MSELIPLLAGAHAHRLEKGNAKVSEVTRSTALVVLNQLNPAIGKGLTAAGVDWSSYCRQLELEGPITPQAVEDVVLHNDFIEALTQFRRSHPDRQAATTENLALAIIAMAATSETGLVGDRLRKAGADLNQVVDKLMQATKTGESGASEEEFTRPDEEGHTEGTRPAVWLLQYKVEETPAELFNKPNENSGISWRSTRLIQSIKPGDPVLYWQAINKKTNDRGGLVGTGRFVGGPTSGETESQQRTQKQTNWYFYPTQFVELFHDDPIPRDELIEGTGLDLPWRFGSILEVPPDSAEKISALLIGRGRKGLFPVMPGRESEEAPDIIFIGDAPKTDVDYLNRGDLAFLLAARLNRIWDESNPGTGEGGSWIHRIFCRLFGRRKNSALFGGKDGTPSQSSFVVHIDAPWGGGKTTFASYLARILSPYRAAGSPPDWLLRLPLHDTDYWPEEMRRPWHPVYFNAWQHQHLDPPWWCFYQAIRRQCFDAARTETFSAQPRPPKVAAHRLKAPGIDIPPPPHPGFRFHSWFARNRNWLFLWLRELAWRLFNPKVKTLVFAFLSTWAVALILYRFGLFKPQAFTKALEEGFKVQAGLPALLTTGLVVLFGGATAIWSVVAAFTDSLLPGTPDAAKNYSLGSGDPLERFRLHFAKTMRSIKRPILVVVDDIDRCEPRFVVDLLRGIQTILNSPRVIFILLGDRDWIENAFASVHQAMKGIDVGPEHTFGGRFVEKAIQLSLVLPDITGDGRTSYVRHLLNIHEAAKTDQIDPSLSVRRAEFDEIISTKDTARREEKAAKFRESVGASETLDKPLRDAFLKEIDRHLALRSASDQQLQTATQHRLVPIAPVLPANPRQIKRIINGIALFQEIARIVMQIQPGTDDWRKLALWVVIMTEWPKTWSTLSSFPGLVDRVLGSGTSPEHALPDEQLTQSWVKDIQRNESIMRLLNFSTANSPWSGVRIEAADIERFRAIMPAVGGELLPRPAKNQVSPPGRGSGHDN